MIVMIVIVSVMVRSSLIKRILSGSMVAVVKGLGFLFGFRV